MSALDGRLQQSSDSPNKTGEAPESIDVADVISTMAEESDVKTEEESTDDVQSGLSSSQRKHGMLHFEKNSYLLENNCKVDGLLPGPHGDSAAHNSYGNESRGVVVGNGAEIVTKSLRNEDVGLSPDSMSTGATSPSPGTIRFGSSDAADDRKDLSQPWHQLLQKTVVAKKDKPLHGKALEEMISQECQVVQDALADANKYAMHAVQLALSSFLRDHHSMDRKLDIPRQTESKALPRESHTRSHIDVLHAGMPDRNCGKVVHGFSSSDETRLLHYQTSESDHQSQPFSTRQYAGPASHERTLPPKDTAACTDVSSATKPAIQAVTFQDFVHVSTTQAHDYDIKSDDEDEDDRRKSLVRRREFANGAKDRRSAACRISQWLDERRQSLELKQEDDELEEEEVKTNKRGGNIFANAATMKDQVKKAIAEKPYNVADFYKEEGYPQAVARSAIFEQMTLAVIAFNAIWIAVDTDLNKADVLIDADPIFIVVENMFCCYFSFEWLMRFLAFEKKFNCLRDKPFVFDSILVLAMVLETWVMTIIVAIVGLDSVTGAGDISLLRFIRLMRLTRMARMARLIRVVPEIMVLIKAIAVSARSVFFTILLLMAIIYIFAILFVQLTAGSEVGTSYFRGVMPAMGTLLMEGNLPDHATFVDDVYDGSFIWGVLLMIFIFITAMTVMGMLAGILVEVVNVVSAVEKEKMAVDFVKEELYGFLNEVDKDNDQCLSKSDFESLVVLPACAKSLSHVGVDVIGLTDFMDYIFEDKDKISFQKFMELVLQLRGTNTATVKDIVDMRRFMVERVNEKFAELLQDEIVTLQVSLEKTIKNFIKTAIVAEKREKANRKEETRKMNNTRKPSRRASNPRQPTT